MARDNILGYNAIPIGEGHWQTSLLHIEVMLRTTGAAYPGPASFRVITEGKCFIYPNRITYQPRMGML